MDGGYGEAGPSSRTRFEPEAGLEWTAKATQQSSQKLLEGCCKWSLLENQLEKGLIRKVSLIPMRDDRAILKCVSSAERVMLLGKNGGQSEDLIAKIVPWSPDLHWSKSKWGGVNCWIWIRDIPLNLWNEEELRSIGGRFGGLLEIDRGTWQQSNMERAILKVKGKWRGFLPTEIKVPCGSRRACFRVGCCREENERQEVFPGIATDGKGTEVPHAAWWQAPRGERITPDTQTEAESTRGSVEVASRNWTGGKEVAFAFNAKEWWPRNFVQTVKRRDGKEPMEVEVERWIAGPSLRHTFNAKKMGEDLETSDGVRCLLCEEGVERQGASQDACYTSQDGVSETQVRARPKVAERPLADIVKSEVESIFQLFVARAKLGLSLMGSSEEEPFEPTSSSTLEIVHIRDDPPTPLIPTADGTSSSEDTPLSAFLSQNDLRDWEAKGRKLKLRLKKFQP
ncbi:hypothetical protein Syun_001682 [Stephania yunnanensis]|uniref:DUF4283 domain-containing protein n=1 Tax=Stephania yunnanensis TaxID=152371 RepID=A0AAP0LE55_9MAGN